MNTRQTAFDAYYANKTPGNACRLAADDLSCAPSMREWDFIDNIRKAGELADHAPDLLAMLERVTAHLDSCARIFNHPRFTDRGQDGPRCSGVVSDARALIAQVKGE
jgi:hypothetical protein